MAGEEIGAKTVVAVIVAHFCGPLEKRRHGSGCRQRIDRAVAGGRQRRCRVGVARGGEGIVAGDNARREGAVEAVAGAGRVDGVDPVTGDVLARVCRSRPSTPSAPIFSATSGAPAGVAPVENRVRFARAGEQRRFVEARQEPIAERQRGDDHRPRARQRPQLEAQVGIVGNPARRTARAASSAAKTLSHALALIAWLMPDTCSTFAIADHVQRQIGRTHAARRRTGAKVAELVAAIAVGHEIDAGGRVWIGAHAADVDALALPELEEFPPEGIVAQPRDVGGASAEPRGGDDAVRGVAAEALQVVLCFRARLIEFEQRFAKRDEIEPGVVPQRTHQRAFNAANPAA